MVHGPSPDPEIISFHSCLSSVPLSLFCLSLAVFSLALPTHFSPTPLPSLLSVAPPLLLLRLFPRILSNFWPSTKKCPQCVQNFPARLKLSVPSIHLSIEIVNGCFPCVSSSPEVPDCGRFFNRDFSAAVQESQTSAKRTGCLGPHAHLTHTHAP